MTSPTADGEETVETRRGRKGEGRRVCYSRKALSSPLGVACGVEGGKIRASLSAWKMTSLLPFHVKPSGPIGAVGATQSRMVGPWENQRISTRPALGVQPVRPLPSSSCSFSASFVDRVLTCSRHRRGPRTEDLASPFLHSFRLEVMMRDLLSDQVSGDRFEFVEKSSGSSTSTAEILNAKNATWTRLKSERLDFVQVRCVARWGGTL